MDEVAAAAAVGKGTLYRRFGDRAGLALALLDQRERALQHATVFGPPPLGPGAPTATRVCAFLDALVDFNEESGDLLVLAEGGLAGSRFAHATYAFRHRHLALLIADLDPRLDAEVLADLLLAPLAAELHQHLRRTQGLSRERLVASLHALARGLGAAAGCAGPAR